MYQLIVAVEAGASLILEDGFTYPAAVLKKIEAEGATGFPGVPSMFALLLRMDLDSFDLASLRYITNAGGPLPTPHIIELRRRLPALKIFSMYGLTEAKRVLYLPPEDIDAKPDSVGIAIPGTEVWLEDPEGNRLGPGEVGELVVRGRHVMRGYWRAPEATAQRFRPGPLPGERVCHTGDLFRMDQDGYFYFVSRQDDIIKSRGEKVAPKEVEDVLCAMEGVAEAAVAGVPDPLLGEAIKAFIVMKPGQALSSGEVIAYCRARLEDFMVPKYVEFRDGIPKTEVGKIARRELKPCAESPVYSNSAAARGSQSPAA
jgi:acyl-coenzyme A synthetase/AMP-(fatty) acid ligase